MAKTVLVVDDNPDFLELLDDILTSNGYQVVTCPAPVEAHDKARSLRPSAVIVDLVMPEWSGWQVIDQIKEDPRTADIPVIVCSAAVPQALQQASLLRELGCEVLPKPFSLDDLLCTLARVTV